MIYERLLKVLAGFQFADVDMSLVSPKASLTGDLGLSSLMLMWLVCDLETEFSIEIPLEDLWGIVTMQDVEEYIEKRCKA